ncbi:hypothetical protein ANAEL_03882 [Anaerolineales bacterium]|nr:hypothetical protein ANAEL_03882 [Anaerolineales bacterium]
MKKIPALLLFVFLISACSMTVDEILGRQPATPIPLPTNTPTAAPTLTPTVPSPTFTSTPTMIGMTVKSPTPFSSPTSLVLTQPGVIPMSSVTPIALVTQVKMEGFFTVAVSDEVFYKGKDCQPVSTKITAQVTDIGNTAFVVLFVRFKSKQTGATSEWTSIGMQPAGTIGFYSHELFPLEMKGLDAFENAWVEYQVVATKPNSKEVGRTGIFSERLTLLECVLTPTPSPSITPTVLVP